MDTKILGKIRVELKENVDEHIRDTATNFFKEEIKVYGIKTNIVSKMSKRYFAEVKDSGKREVFLLCEELFKSGYMEESFIACNWSYGMHELFEKKDIDIFEAWIRKYVSNWATCDTLCNHTVGALVEKFPDLAERLKKWAKSENRWMRRASAVTLIIPAKKGLFMKDALEISDLLLKDKDDLVQKGYGWLLKEESRTRQKEVFDYVMKNKKEMPRTALRYAIEKMPQELRKRAMKK